ncbi:MAG: energy-coupled thiamine transporter ThiT, partial [Acetivibrio sp.]
LVDYPLAFGALGLSGFFWKKKNGLLKGYVAGILGRYVFSVLSGWLFFGQYAWEGWNPLPYALAYNGAYIFTEAAITILLLLLVKPLKNGLSYIKRMTQE